jgi:hypothetical protein
MYVSLTVLFTCRESFDTGITDLPGPLTPDPDKHRGRKATKMLVSGGYPVRSSLLLLSSYLPAVVRQGPERWSGHMRETDRITWFLSRQWLDFLKLRSETDTSSSLWLIDS